MHERSKRISRLKADRQSRQSYVFSKIAVLVPSQIKALRLTSSTPTQKELAAEAETHQSRLSALEKPGAANVTLETLAWIASIHKVGLLIKFVSHSEMLRWENNYSQDAFTVTRLDADEDFLNPGIADISPVRVNSGENQPSDTQTFMRPPSLPVRRPKSGQKSPAASAHPIRQIGNSRYWPLRQSFY